MSNKALEKLKKSGDIQTLLPDNDRYTNRFEIKSSSSNRLYVVAQNKKTGDWSCSCPAWITRRKCKHLTTLTPLLSNVKNKPELKKISAPAQNKKEPEADLDVEIHAHDPFFTDQKVLWAKKLNCREYRNEISGAEERQAKKDGVVIVFGASDDLMEFRGAINDEIGCYGGEKVYFNKSGSNFNDIEGTSLNGSNDKSKPEKNMIEAVWCPNKPNCSWIYKTKIPHEKFNILEDEDLYCVGIVFNISDLK